MANRGEGSAGIESQARAISITNPNRANVFMLRCRVLMCILALRFASAFTQLKTEKNDYV